MPKTPLSSLRILLHVCKTIYVFSPLAALSIILLMLIRSLTSGIGLLLVIPLLQMVGIATLEHHSSIPPFISNILVVIHIPLQLLSLLCLFIAIMIGVASVQFLEEMASSKWQKRYQAHLRREIYQAILHTHWSYFNQINRDELLHGITSQLQASLQCHIQIIHLIGQLILVSVYLTLSGIVSWQMTLLASGIALILLGTMFPLHRRIAESGRLLLAQHQKLFHLFYEQISAFKMIKTCRAEESCVLKIMEGNAASDHQIQRTTLIRAMSKWCYAVGTAMALSVILYVAIAIIHLPTETLVLLLLIFSRLMPKISSLQQNYQLILRHLPVCESLKRLIESCMAHQEHHGTTQQMPIDFQHSICLKEVSFQHQNRPIIENFSMIIPKNTTTLLCGPSGAGKTTVADMIAGLLDSTSGTVHIDTTCLNEQTRLAWRKSVAYVMQEAHLFNTSIRENLCFFTPDATEDDIWSVLALISAKTFISKLEHGLETIVGDRGTHLSGGERQRIALARALLMKPQLLILDESTNALDKETLAVIQQALINLRGTITILIISHQPEMGHYADQIISMNTTVKGT